MPTWPPVHGCARPRRRPTGRCAGFRHRESARVRLPLGGTADPSSTMTLERRPRRRSRRCRRAPRRSSRSVRRAGTTMLTRAALDRSPRYPSTPGPAISVRRSTSTRCEEPASRALCRRVVSWSPGRVAMSPRRASAPCATRSSVRQPSRRNRLDSAVWANRSLASEAREQAITVGVEYADEAVVRPCPRMRSSASCPERTTGPPPGRGAGARCVSTTEKGYHGSSRRTAFLDLTSTERHEEAGVGRAGATCDAPFAQLRGSTLESRPNPSQPPRSERTGRGSAAPAPDPPGTARRKRQADGRRTRLK